MLFKSFILTLYWGWGYVITFFLSSGTRSTSCRTTVGIPRLSSTIRIDAWLYRIRIGRQTRKKSFLCYFSPAKSLRKADLKLKIRIFAHLLFLPFNSLMFKVCLRAVSSVAISPLKTLQLVQFRVGVPV